MTKCYFPKGKQDLVFPKVFLSQKTGLISFLLFFLTFTSFGQSLPEDEVPCTEGVSMTHNVDMNYAIDSNLQLRMAEDFVVEPYISSFTVEVIKIVVNQEEAPNHAEIHIREDNANSPGAILHTITQAPDDFEIIGEQFGDPIFELTFELDNPVELASGKYWLDPNMSTPNGVQVFWAVTHDLVHGEKPYRSFDGGETWEQDLNEVTLIFNISGVCNEIECEGTPDAGTISVNTETIYPGQSYTVSATGYSEGGGLTYQWQSNTDGAGWINEGETTNTYSDFTAVAPEFYDLVIEWRLEITCTHSGETAISNIAEVEVIDDSNGCLWTVSVSSETFGDEVSWELRNPENTVLISGGGYGMDYEDTQTVFAEGPLTFYGETMGSFGDNEMSYEISNGTEVLASGHLEGSTEITIEDLNCDLEPGGDECSQGISSFESVPNGYNIELNNSHRTAEDFTVEEGEEFLLQTITIDVNQSEVPNVIEIKIYDDIEGTPGSVLHTLDVIPDSAEIVGNAFGDPIYHLVFELSTPIEFLQGTYWLDPKMSTPNGETVYWAATDQASDGAYPQRSTNDGITWEEDTRYHMVFTVSGMCEAAEDCDGTPEGGVAFTEPEEGNPGSTYRVRASEYTNAGNMSYQWQSNTDDAGWVDEGDEMESYSSYAAIAPVAIGASVDWRLKVTCNTSEETTYSEIATFTTIEPECGMETPRPAEFDDAHGNLHILEIANDFIVNTGETMSVTEFSFNVLLPPGSDLHQAEIRVYTDSGSGPGTQIYERTGAVPQMEFLEDVFGFNLYTASFQFSDLHLDGNETTETTYWIGVLIDTNAQNSYWEVTSAMNTANEEYIYSEGVWETSTIAFGGAVDGVMKITGECRTLNVHETVATNFIYYPNPVEDILNLKTDASIESVSIFNITGQQIISLDGIHAQNNQIDMSSLTSGMYLVQAVFENGQIETFKVVKN